jgi:hypothetical protein
MSTNDRTPVDPESRQRQPQRPAPAEAAPCPFCHSTETEVLSLFGSQLSTMQYYCRTCHTPFEYIRREPEPHA